MAVNAQEAVGGPAGEAIHDLQVSTPAMFAGPFNGALPATARDGDFALDTFNTNAGILYIRAFGNWNTIVSNIGG